MVRRRECRNAFENGLKKHTYCGTDCRAYAKQVAWNRMMRRLYEDAGQSVREVPAPPDYSTPEAVTARIKEAAEPRKCTHWKYSRPLGGDCPRAWYYSTILPMVLKQRARAA